jgi:hypothetical protein
MASVLLFILMLILLGSLPLGLQDPATLLSVLGVLGITVVAIFLNRAGQVYVVGGLLSIAMTVALGFVLVGAPKGLDVDYLQIFYLLLLSELLGAALLPPGTVFLLAFVNTGITVAALSLEHTGPMLTALLNNPDVGFFTLVFPPIALFWAVAGVSFLLVRSATTAIQRADRAEEIAELQRRDVERTQELEEGVRQLLAAHVRLANGDFNTRAPSIRNPLLWQIGNSLNNLISRLARFAQADFLLRRTQEEALRLAETINAWAQGRAVTWPAQSQTPLDPVVTALRRGTGPDQGGQPGQPGAAMRPSMPGQMPPAAQLPSASRVPWSPSSIYGASSGRGMSVPEMPTQSVFGGNPHAALPDWLRPLMPEGSGTEGAGGGGDRASVPYTPSVPPAPRDPPQQPSGGDPWSLDPEANLPDWLRTPFETDGGDN